MRRDGDVPLADKPAEVVRRCIRRGILVPYFERRRVEVEDIMFTLFDQERETELYMERVAREVRERSFAQGRDEGFALGRDEGFTQGKNEGFAQGRNEGYAQGRDEGYSDGVEQGIEQGIARGIEQGIARGIEQGKVTALSALVDDGLLSLDQAAARLDVTPEHFSEMRAQAE